MQLDDLSRQRLDFSEGPNGETIAVLTVTLQDGSVHRYTAQTDQDEIDNLASVLAVSESRLMRAGIGAHMSEEEISGFLDSIVKGVKAIGNVAKKVVTSKVFRVAGKGLAMAAPALGPFAPAAMAVSAGMATASKIGAAAIAAEGGARRASKNLARIARKKASASVRGNTKSLGKLMRSAAGKRRSAWKVLGKRARKITKTTRKRRTPSTKRPDIMLAARRGKLRSNQKGSVTSRTLATAARRGRVYWIAA